MRHMTKHEALRLFREEILPLVRKQYGRYDRVARAEEFSNFIDMLHRDGSITRHQADTWTNPY